VPAAYFQAMEKTDKPAAVVSPTPPTPSGTHATPPPTAAKPPKEIGGPKGPEPTRYGDWERNGRCVDF